MAGSVPWTEDDLADGRHRVGRAGGPGREPGPRRWATVALAVAGLLASAVAGGGIVYLLIGGKDAEVAGPPPLIAAEDRPIKVAPDNPGGMEVPNRDKMIYSRLKGEDERHDVERLLPPPEQPQLPPSGQLDELVRSDVTRAPTLLLPPDDAAVVSGETPAAALPPPAPVPAEAPAPVPPPAAESPAPPVKQEQVALSRPVPSSPPAKPAAKAVPPKSTAAATGRFQVQLLAVRSEQDAKAAWQRLQDKNSDVLGGLSYSVQRADLGAQGVFYRLRAGPIADEAKAKSICSTLSGRNVSCLIIKPKR